MPQKQPRKGPTDQEMREEEARFREGLDSGNEEDDYLKHLSRVKIEKEINLFRMYLNIKRRLPPFT